MTDAQLGCREILETFENDLLHVSFAIAVGVFEVIEVRSAGDIHTTIPGHHTVRESEAIGEDSAFVKIGRAHV